MAVIVEPGLGDIAKCPRGCTMVTRLRGNAVLEALALKGHRIHRAGIFIYIYTPVN